MAVLLVNSQAEQLVGASYSRGSCQTSCTIEHRTKVRNEVHWEKGMEGRKGFGERQPETEVRKHFLDIFERQAEK